MNPDYTKQNRKTNTIKKAFHHGHHALHHGHLEIYLGKCTISLYAKKVTLMKATFWEMVFRFILVGFLIYFGYFWLPVYGLGPSKPQHLGPEPMVPTGNTGCCECALAVGLGPLDNKTITQSDVAYVIKMLSEKIMGCPKC
jgi:hypothetical protein